MLRYLLPLGMLFLLSFCTPTAQVRAAEPVDPELQEVQRVNKAIDDGVQYLLRTRDAKQHWESYWIEQMTGMDGGITALATLALLNCGVKADDPAVATPIKYLRTLRPQKTYVVGLINLVLQEAKNPNDLAVIQSNTNWLLENAIRGPNGRLTGWSYPAGDLSRADASNTQYALLGLYAAQQAGAKIDNQVWKDIQELYLSMISKGRDEGDWSYIEGVRRPSFTMTVAGVSGLIIARMGLEDSPQQLDPKTGIAAKCGDYPEGDAIRRGMNWIGERFAFKNAEGSKSLFYNVYGIERVGRLSGQRFVGKADWYREGCDFLTRSQKADGSWHAENDTNFRGVNIISTSFALLFLSKGRSPVLISKMAHGEFVMNQNDRILFEKSANPAIIDWHRKRGDAMNLTEFASKALFKNLTLGWQTYDPRRTRLETEEEILSETGLLVQSPILYITGHNAPRLTGGQKRVLKKYLQEGGFVIAEACCGSKEFAAGFRELMQDPELFPNQELKTVPPEHALWRSHFLVAPTEFPKLECMDLGCRTVLVFSPEPLAGYWEERKYMPAPNAKATNRGESAFHLAGNIIAYATGKEPPKQRLAQRKIVEANNKERSPKNGFLEPVQLRLDEAPPAEGAMKNLMSYLRDNAKLDVVIQKPTLMNPNDDDLFKFKFLYMHGRKGFDFDDEGILNLQANLQSGGLLLADACCGSEAFDTAFRKLAAKLFPTSALVEIPLDDLLYSAKLNRVAIETVERREKMATANSGNDAGFERLPPKLEGIKVDGRWVVIYSRYDIGCALEGHKTTDCLGHTPDSAKKLASAAVLYSLKR